jgi:hypothetical protein
MQLLLAASARVLNERVAVERHLPGCRGDPFVRQTLLAAGEIAERMGTMRKTVKSLLTPTIAYKSDTSVAAP